MSKQHAVAIPESFLLTLAVHGDMGDGELPHLMQDWAEKECVRLGLNRQVAALREEKIAELKKRLSAVFGAGVVNNIEKEVGVAANLLKERLKR